MVSCACGISAHYDGSRTRIDDYPNGNQRCMSDAPCVVWRLVLHMVDISSNVSMTTPTTTFEGKGADTPFK